METLNIVYITWACVREYATRLLLKTKRTLWLAGSLASSSDAYTLNVISRLYRANESTLGASFSSIFKTHYGIENPDEFVVPLDFANEPEQSRTTINCFVAQQTQNKILDLVPDHSVSTWTKNVTAAAAYFLAEWKEPFDEKFTAPETFSRSDKTKVMVPIMKGLKTARMSVYKTCSMEANNTAWEIGQIPYVGDSMAMKILHARLGKGPFSQMERSLDPSIVQELHRNLGEPKTNVVSLPKFRLSLPSVNLGMTFESLGFDDYRQLGDAWHRAFMMSTKNTPKPRAQASLRCEVKASRARDPSYL